MKPRLSQGRSPLFSSALSCQAAIGFAGPPRFRSFFGENGLFVLRETAAPGSDSVSTQTSASGLEHELVACLSGMPESLRMSSCKIKDCQLHRRRREGSFGRHYCPCVTQPQPLFIRPPYASCLSGLSLRLPSLMGFPTPITKVGCNIS